MADDRCQTQVDTFCVLGQFFAASVPKVKKSLVFVRRRGRLEDGGGKVAVASSVDIEVARVLVTVFNPRVRG